MLDFAIKNEPFLRLGFFFGVLALISFWELLKPRRKLTQRKSIRWYSNLGIVALNTLLLRFLFPMSAVAFALVVQKNNWGLFNNTGVSFAFAIVASVVLLDLAIYLQHVMFHFVPAFWRLHRMHHADLDIDVTTGNRFHPLEILLSMGIKFSVIALLGAPAIAVLIFEILLNATSMFSHGNIDLPAKVDKVLRWIVVSPDMHRIHHSIHVEETNSNFGFNLPWWDRFFGTYRRNPRDGHTEMTIGIDLFREQKYLNLHWLLVQPFLSGKDRYASGQNWLRKRRNSTR
ncbi:MAG: sterol desaturase family protein [Pseudobdellovibrionaceae bacterium]